ncbi:MAG: hypothetical protein WD076_07590 [Parvularculaceae bacterium]
MHQKIITIAALVLIAACSRAPEEPGPAQAERLASPASTFIANLKGLCGKAFEGRVVSTDEADAAFASERLVMHVRDCEDMVVRIPFHVGENRSRTWVMTRTPDGLRLKHDHRHEDGSEDAVTQYGGDTSAPGSNERQEFPVDSFSIDLFNREGLTASVTNVWAMDVRPGELFAYELRRPNRFFRVEFDLTKPVEAPPPAWGAEG